MTQPPGAIAPPRSLLLATDLSSRGDRALDRTRQLAQEWGAHVHVVHAVDALAPSVPVGVDAEHYLQQHPDLVPEASRALTRLIDDLPATLHVERGNATQAILAVAEREGCDLILLGERRERLIGPLEGTMDQLLRSAPVSVLVVRSRANRAYRQLLVGTDYTDEALQALSRACDLFPQAEVTVVHAYDPPYAGLRDDPTAQAWDAPERARLRAHVAQAGLLERTDRGAIRLRVEAGPPASVLSQWIASAGTDLTVIGAHPRGMLYDAMVGRSRLIVDAIPGDILVVRAVRRDAE